MKKIPLACLLLIHIMILQAQEIRNDSSIYHPQDFFLQPFNPPAGNIYRSAKGTPGPQYWQNSSSYLIHATLNEQDTSITGDVTITYVNNSPDKLEYIWLQLDQNIFNPKSRGAAATPASNDAFGILGLSNGGYHITGVSIVSGGKTSPVQPVISDTRMQIRLPQPLQSRGDQISIKMNFSFGIPENGAGRFGRLYTSKGVLYQIAQWYPRMCVYDDVEGWNTLPYMGQGEFYCDYGNYDFYVTVPAEMIVYGSGDLQNASEVLTSEEIKRLSTAANSDKTVPVIQAGEIGKPSMRPAAKGFLTWHYKMDNTRDVAWAACRGLVWDAAKINLSSGRKALAMSAYPPEAMGDTAWSRSTEYLKNSIEIYSKNFFEYPWNNAISIGGSISGMEYPGLIYNDYRETRARLWFLIAHEIGHNWFPMIVGSNERKYMWQDEGFNSYINYYATDIFNKGEYVNDPAFFGKDFFASRDYKAFMTYRDPLMVVSEAMDIKQHYQYYGKTAYGLNLLRNVVVGKERFDYAFRKYTENWAFKHPTPYDFFHCINNAAGEDLNWFWKEWFFTDWKLDQAITSVKYIDNNPSLGVWITIENKGRMIMPVIVKIMQANGDSSVLQLPVDIWMRDGSWTFKYPSVSKIDKLILDPENVLPDMNRSNNVWVTEGK
jgi:Peptidase family M1 domain